MTGRRSPPLVFMANSRRPFWRPGGSTPHAHVRSLSNSYTHLRNTSMSTAIRKSGWVVLVSPGWRPPDFPGGWPRVLPAAGLGRLRDHSFPCGWLGERVGVAFGGFSHRSVGEPPAAWPKRRMIHPDRPIRSCGQQAFIQCGPRRWPAGHSQPHQFAALTYGGAIDSAACSMSICMRQELRG
jgi:hypothetical protein